jgi:predicted amidohydrolase
MNMKKQFIQVIFITFFLLFLVPNILTGETGKPVRIASLCFVSGSQSVKNIAAVIDQQSEKGIDLVCLPEAWTGSKPEDLQGETVLTISALAKKHRCYICCPIIVERDGMNFNSAILFDRDGKVACVYDKIYPYWSELRTKNPVTPAQKDVVVYDTDFGRIGFLICYDAKFPEVWRRLRDEGAELVVWPSAYSADTE